MFMTIETIKGEGTTLIERVKQIIHEGNVRRVVIKQGEETVAEFPLTFGVVGAVLAPVLAAIGALVALLNDCTIEVERITDRPTPEEPLVSIPVMNGVPAEDDTKVI
jgi:hypothetical protein